MEAKVDRQDEEHSRLFYIMLVVGIIGVIGFVVVAASAGGVFQ